MATTVGTDTEGRDQVRGGALADTEAYSAAGRRIHIGSSRSPLAVPSVNDAKAALGVGGVVEAAGLADGTAPVQARVGWIRVYFSSVDDGDTYTTGYKGVYLGLFQGDDVDNDFVNAFVTNGTGELKKGIIEFQSSGDGKTGWLWLLVDRDLNPNAPFLEFA